MTDSATTITVPNKNTYVSEYICKTNILIMWLITVSEPILLDVSHLNRDNYCFLFFVRSFYTNKGRLRHRIAYAASQEEKF